MTGSGGLGDASWEWGLTGSEPGDCGRRCGGGSEERLQWSPLRLGEELIGSVIPGRFIWGVQESTFGGRGAGSEAIA